MKQFSVADEFDGWSDAEVEFYRLWQQLAPTAPLPEHDVLGVIPNRRYRADFLWRKTKTIVEIEGGAWTRGRHTRGPGYEADCEKYNLLTAMGYRVFRFTPGMIQRDPHRWIALVQAFADPIPKTFKKGKND